MIETRPLWHGGCPGLVEGDLIRPPDETGLTYTRIDQTIAEGVTDPISQRRDRVYVTTDRELAKVYASEYSADGVVFGGGWLYKVTVEDEDLELDDDLLSLPGVSYQCRQARVERVWQRDVKSTPAKSRQVIERVLGDWQAAKDAKGTD